MIEPNSVVESYLKYQCKYLCTGSNFYHGSKSITRILNLVTCGVKMIAGIIRFKFPYQDMMVFYIHIYNDKIDGTPEVSQGKFIGFLLFINS